MSAHLKEVPGHGPGEEEENRKGELDRSSEDFPQATGSCLPSYPENLIQPWLPTQYTSVITVTNKSVQTCPNENSCITIDVISL